MKRNSVILIPALNPDKELIQYIQELKRNGFDDIIVVNDGSSAEYLDIFERAKQMDCKVLQHAVNLGKGRALKNGFNEFLNLYQDNPDILGIINWLEYPLRAGQVIRLQVRCTVYYTEFK